MPEGVHNLRRLRMFWLEGNTTHGLEGGLPPKFWHVRTRMLLLATMGPQFTGHLEPSLPVCDYLDFRVYMYRLPSFTGDVSALQRCRNVKGVFEVFLNPRLGGNVWKTMLGWDKVAGSINMWGSNFSGQIPFALTSNLSSRDEWVKWCEARRGARLNFKVVQQVGGQLPLGLQACSNMFTKFDVQSSDISGSFPLDLSSNTIMGPANLKLWVNKFTGPIPDIPEQTTIIDLHGNRWTGTIPSSWSKAASLDTIDLSDCAITGPLPEIISNATFVKLSGNNFFGQVPSRWFSAPLRYLDLSDNNISGPFASFGWPGKSPNGNHDPRTFVEAFSSPPPWPLKTLLLSNNPLGISAGFLLGMLSWYSLEVLEANNCSLHGSVKSDDLVPHMIARDGSVQKKAGAVGFTALTELSMASNDLAQFGYDEDDSPTSCWQQTTWTEQFVSLRKLDLSDCASLRRVHPMSFSLDALNLEGSKSLIAPPVVNSTLSCDSVRGQPSKECVGVTWQSCMIRSNRYTDMEGAGGLECAGLLVQNQNGVVRELPIDKDVFDRSFLCRCGLASTELDGDKCVPSAVPSVPDDSSDDDSSVVLYVVLGCVGVALVLSVVVCYIVWRRRAVARDTRPSDSGPSTTGAQAAAKTAAKSQSESLNSMSDTDTSQLFADMNIMEIAAKGVQEHWVIMPSNINVVELDVAQGSFGTVARGFLYGTTEVAIKTPSSESAVSEGRFISNELRLLRRLRHTNVVLFYGVTATNFMDGTQNKTQLSLVLEWISGGNFGDFVRERRKNGQFDEDILKDTSGFVVPEVLILTDVARGMGYLHGQDPPVIHRDLKPGNILIEASNPPRGKISDFGLSALVDSNSPGRAGTSNYSAPEIASGESYDVKSDVFSFGCVCYYVLVAQHPNPGTVNQDCLKLTSKQRVPSLVCDVALRCLQEVPSSRLDFYSCYKCLVEKNGPGDASTHVHTSSANPSGGLTGTGTGTSNVQSDTLRGSSTGQFSL
eukprot:TRINITY_DN5337_c0_g1_i2.p1 TRINITY_DN5337_c0_g1~~TRINITY_DN5337_c0_g1_i2.p1  ORF type:complete len:1153 (+),score=109.07 TRINITY_DN5337_c0_g1_i2:477-3461(+)